VKNVETSEKQPVEPPDSIALRLQVLTGRLADGAGHLAAATLLILALSIVLGITLRQVHVDNSWTYDLDLYMLAWLSFIGAGLTSLRNHHVTAGISLENLLGGRGKVLGILRFAIVGTFLVLFTVSGFRQAYSSFVSNETTLDVVQWPVWVAKAALPLGAAFWLAAEVHKLLRRFTGGGE
jgi:TRAP-type C4-dicarboxylate transport system permease small subunit